MEIKEKAILRAEVSIQGRALKGGYHWNISMKHLGFQLFGPQFSSLSSIRILGKNYKIWLLASPPCVIFNHDAPPGPKVNTPKTVRFPHSTESALPRFCAIFFSTDPAPSV